MAPHGFSRGFKSSSNNATGPVVGHPPSGPPPGSAPGHHPPGPPAPGGDNIATPNYFTDQKKGEVNELMNLLRNISNDRDQKKKREVVKKVIAYMTLGIDVSRLFSEMVKCVDTRDLILKKMVYLYLTNYARKNSDLAIMCINTLLNDCRNEDPMVRGLALRSLCGLRLESILEYIHDPLQHSLTDSSAYVRKTGVMGILKVFHMNKELIQDTEMVDTLYNMLKDRDPQVVSNCLMVLNEIMLEEGGMAINRQIISHLLQRMSEFNEWGQCNILKILSTYVPSSQEELFHIMNILDPCLRISNSAVLLAASKCFIELTKDQEELQAQVFLRLKPALLTLLAGGSHELNHAVLHHIALMVKIQHHVFSSDYRQFYVRYNEPSYIKYVKLEIMGAVASRENVADVVSELSEYVMDVDQEMSKRAVRAIAKIAMTCEGAAHEVFDTLVAFLEMDLDHHGHGHHEHHHPVDSSNSKSSGGFVAAQTIVVMKDLLRKYPENRHDVLSILPRLVQSMDDAEGKCALVWMLGEYGSDVPRSPYVLEPLIDAWMDEPSPQVCLEILSATLKLFFKRPAEVQSMLGRLLLAATSDSRNQDVHDRALLYYRLLATGELDLASSVVLRCATTKKPIDVFAELVQNDVQDKIFHEFNSLSVVYGKPAEVFVVSSSRAGLLSCEEEEDLEEDILEEEEEDLESSDEEQDDLLAESSSFDSSSQAQNPGLENHHQQGAAVPFQQQQQQQELPVVVPSSSSVLDDFMPPPPQHHTSPPRVLLELVPHARIDAQMFQQKWGSVPPNGEFQSQLASVPTQVSVEEALRQEGILTMASGDVGSQYKFFFYAQDTLGVFYLAESIFDKATRVFSCTIKADDGSKSADFGVLMDQVVRRF